MGDRLAEYSALYALGLVAQVEGDPAAAERRFRDALALAAELGDNANVVACFKGLGGVVAAQGAAVRAARVWGAAVALRARQNSAVYVSALDHAVYEPLVAAVRAELGKAAFAAAWAEGEAMRLDQAITYALTCDDSRS